MKIQKNKDKNINEESKKALKDFKQNQINSNIKLHKIFLILIILINIGLIFFIYFYKSKISQIKKLSKSHTSKIDSNDIQIETKKASIYNKMVNIASISSYGTFRFSFIFDKSEEFQLVKKLIFDYKKELGEITQDYDETHTIFMYQGVTDSDEYSVFMEKISFFEGVIIMVQTVDKERFGIYHKDTIIPDDKHNFDSECKDVFLFTLDSNKIYKFKGKKYSMHFNKKTLISLGDDEFVIYNEYFDNGGYINFPLKSFDFSNVNNNILTKTNGKLNIRNVEVFCFF